ncbi:MAG: aldehyde dehydrogenase family protein, partial [Thermoanaerobaculia bacterium]|nr:aldehyde dehydrogenase family protein [Thermoanaerobaculia bacterium]
MTLLALDRADSETPHRASGWPSRPESPPETPRAELDRALSELRDGAEGWSRVSLADRRAILRELVRDYLAVSEAWADAGRRAEGLPEGEPVSGEEWLSGPYMVIRNLRLLDRSLEDMEASGKPRIPGPVRELDDGRASAQVFPHDLWDRILYSGVKAEVWMQDGIGPGELRDTMAVAYATPADQRDPSPVCLVLGAGNVSSIGPMDVLYKVFVENRVILLKMHEVNAYLGSLLERGFEALVDWGALRIVYGGVEVGKYLCEHQEVDEIHITGSDRTVEAIVFGVGEKGARRREERRPKNTRPISSELGNVSPVIVVPGPWSARDFAYHGENLASMLVNNAGFNCNAARVVVQHESWSGRAELWSRLEAAVRKVPTRRAFYPGAHDRYRSFVEAHPEALEIGPVDSVRPEDELPWALIPDVPDSVDEICFREEAFCGVLSETGLEAEGPADFLDRAVRFCNERLWGTLNATILIHPASRRDPEVGAAFDRALRELRYGTIAVNGWAAVGYGLVITPWGAPPGHDIYDIQSGVGVVHNTLMFDRVEKTIVETP